MDLLIEVETPLLWDVETYIEGLANLESFPTIVLAENGGVSAIAIGEALKGKTDKEVFIKITCRDRNRIALHSDLLTAAAKGLTNVVLAEGGHPVQTRFPAAKPVYELDSLLLLKMMRQANPSFGKDLVVALGSLPWKIAVCIGGATAADMSRAEKLHAAGADLFFVASLEAVKPVRRLTDKPIFVSMYAENVSNLGEMLSTVESSGAQGMNLVLKALDKVIDGSIIRK
ncbi:MAG: hypothetical protein C4532_09000 [Candidatus Abyssobacteria bacterium SURF_17]|uniref:Uncharacterized protein n=1 Tax=Candidatus Abyssobacteria bacterium SURF_17 TaxID=2093361 RepID=A0A419EZL9_9BACT|nr:MAG: hypothetical protein C4532_09000 [Candidatus Abyssubacteria bacterium SURF_17]